MIKFVTLTLLLIFPYVSYADKVIVKKIKEQGLKIIKFENDLYSVQLKKRKLKVGRYYLILRVIDDSNFDLLAQGKVEANQGDIAYVQLLEEQMYKIPKKGDYLIPIGSGVFEEDIEGESSGGIIAKENVGGEEPGYIQLGFAFNSGEYNTDSSTIANAAKIVKYNFYNTHFKWYFDFFWRLGVEYNFYSDDVPTATYYRNKFDSKRKFSDLKINYRLKKWGNSNIRSTFIVNLISDEFTTKNTDENLLSTTYDLVGFGKKFSYEFYPDYSELKGFKFQFNKVYLSTVYYPIVDVKDLGVSRGDSSKAGFSYSYAAGLEATIFWDKIPFIKRWFINVEFQSLLYDSLFSGATVSETNSLYKIPEGTETQEQQDTFKVLVGFRIKDYIGQFFKPR